MRPQMTYDPEADAVYVHLSDERPFQGADVSPGVTLHFAEDGRVVGVEMLPASKTLAPGEWQNAPMPGSAKAHAAE
jgi:uncharacterized protein YuzE